MKCYTCGQYPSLRIAGVGTFVGGVLELESGAQIGRLEASDSFKQGIVREFIQDPAAVVPLPEKKDVVKLKKQQLLDFAEEYGLEVEEGATRNTLVTLVLEFIDEATEEE